MVSFLGVDHSGPPNIEFLDSVVGMGGTLSQAFKETKLPLGLARSANPTKKVATYTAGKSTKLESGDKITPSPNLLANDCTIGAFGFGGGCGCVDWWGPGSDWLTYWDQPLCDLDIDPIFPPTGGGIGVGGCTPSALTNPQQDFFSKDEKYHNSGSHYGLTVLQSECNLLYNCEQTCQVDVISKIFNDTGQTNETLPYYHVKGTKEKINRSEGPTNSDIECETAVGYGFSNCLLGNCTVFVEVGVTGKGASASATISGGDLWNSDGHILGRTCRMLR